MNTGPTIQTDSTGDDVRRLQRILVMMKSFGPEGIDGIFGPKTEEAVRGFQESATITVDGIVGPETWGALPADPDTPELATGATGTQVSAMQQALHTYSGGNPPGDPGPIDGIFGDLTTAAVEAYQSDVGVAVDGIVGDQTWWAPAGAAGATLASLAGLTTV